MQPAISTRYTSYYRQIQSGALVDELGVTVHAAAEVAKPRP